MKEAHARCPINGDDVNGQTPLHSGGSLAHDKVDIPSEWWRPQSDSDPSGTVGSILLQIDSLSSGGAAAQSTSGDQSGAAASTTPTADAGTANAGAPVKSGNANTDYNAAIALVQDKSRQDDAMVAFQNFIKNYPDSTYLPNANYWLGQLNYNKGKKDDAAYYFASVVKNYPKSPKAADAMFKVGVIMQDKGDTAKAKAVYQQVISKYPGTDGAKQAQKRLNAM